MTEKCDPLNETPKGSAKKWAFTLNNWDEKEYAQLQDLECKAIWLGKEISESGTPHIQGAVCFGDTHRFAALKKLNDRISWGVAKTNEGFINYCMKDRNYWFKDNRAQGKRSDWTVIRNLADKGKFGEIKEDFPMHMIKYPRAIMNLHNIKNKDLSKRNWKTEVHVRWGKPGTGKTSYFYENYSDIHEMYYENSFWSDYNGENVVLWDDFDPSEMSRGTFLRMTDRYPCKVRCLGKFENWKPVTLLITSNYDPSSWYRGDKAVERRLDFVTEVS